jgi:predicted outer membrane repeat protein
LLEVYGSASFNGNTSADNGGAIYVTKESTVSIVADKDIVATFDGNSAGANGGVIYNSSSAITVKAQNGGKVEFKNNEATSSGGVFAIHSNGTNYLYGITATSNTAGESGGVLYVYGSNVVIGDAQNPTKSTFSQNSATSGGAVYISSTKSASVDAKIYDLELLNNTSTETGGALCARVYSDTYTDLSCTVDINKLVANGNTSGGNGGALHIYTFANVKIGTLVANENEATGTAYGGAMYISGKASVEIDSISATSNSAGSGGCIYLTTGGTTLTLNSGDIKGNTASETSKGNALWCNSASSVLKIKTNAQNEYLVDFEDGSILGKSGFAITPVKEDETV